MRAKRPAIAARSASRGGASRIAENRHGAGRARLPRRVGEMGQKAHGSSLAWRRIGQGRAQAPNGVAPLPATLIVPAAGRSLEIFFAGRPNVFAAAAPENRKFL